mgnify:CR=1 FL=1
MGTQFNNTILRSIREQFDFTKDQAMTELNRIIKETQTEVGVLKSELAEAKDRHRKLENNQISLKAKHRDRGVYVELLKTKLREHGHSVPAAP